METGAWEAAVGGDLGEASSGLCVQVVASGIRRYGMQVIRERLHAGIAGC